MALTTSHLLAVIGGAAITIVTAIQHMQITDLRDVVDSQPQVAVTDIGGLGVQLALSSTDSPDERQQRLSNALAELAEAGYIIIDARATLTAPHHRMVTPDTILEAAGIDPQPPSIAPIQWQDPPDASDAADTASETESASTP